MNEAVIAALIAAAASILSNIVLTNKNNRDLQHKLEIHQAVTDAKIDELTRETRKHNNFGERIPVIEEKLAVINHRVTDLESAQNRTR